MRGTQVLSTSERSLTVCCSTRERAFLLFARPLFSLSGFVRTLLHRCSRAALLCRILGYGDMLSRFFTPFEGVL